MNIDLIITKKKAVDLPNALVAAFANDYFKRLGPEVYADLLCRQLDIALKNMQLITHDQVGISDFAAEMTISTLTLVEELQERVHELDILDTEAGEGYEVSNNVDHSAARLSRIIGQDVMRPTMPEARTFCSAIVNVHGKHYQANLMPIIATTTIMTENGKMVMPLEVFWHGDFAYGWDGFREYAEMGGPFIKDIPVTFTTWPKGDMVVGNMMGLFLDRCIFDPKISASIGVKYYQLPLETREELR